VSRIILVGGDFSDDFYHPVTIVPALAWVIVRITIVGCAGSFPGPQSAASCYLVEAGDFRLVLDLGNGALGSLQQYADLDEVDAVCLSHLHADHCLDMCGFTVAKAHHPLGQRRRIPVYAPEGAQGHIGRALSPDPDSTGVRDSFAFIDLEPGTRQIGPLRVTTARMNHPVETYGFRIEHDGQVLAYSADTGPEPELLRLAAGADALLCEASFLDGPDLPADLHLTARQAGEYAARAGAGELVLTHLVAWNDPAAAREQAAQAFDGALALASPGLRVLGGGPDDVQLQAGPEAGA
jgi:ribonuclease BN (tRNA processing enzyme)